ncbi:MAG: PhnD/SsuA/transferrin family substrate-binding protein [Pseudomonadota bacterium]
MIASFPMYDRPQTRGHYAALWDGIRARVGGPLPNALTHDEDPWTHWMSADLVLSQTCGLPFRARLADQVALVGTPDYAVDGCPPGYYRSVAVMRRDDGRADDLHGLRLAYNDPLSQSGWAAAVDHAGGTTFAGYLQTGSHAASAAAIAEDRADIAYIDAVTWRMIARWDDVAQRLRVVDETTPTPSLPFITRAGGPVAELATATRAAIDDLSPSARAATGLQGLVQIPAESYLAQPIPPKAPK